MMEPALRRVERPIAVNCVRCGQPMTLHNERSEPDEQGRLDHVRVYFCRIHGFFHFSDRKPIAAGM